jgi:uncharacterized protein YjbJ (UPF0337 family)
MNKDIFAGKWKQFRGEVKKRWGKLTDDDLDQVEGSYDKFLGRMQERYGYAKERAEKELDELFKNSPAPKAAPAPKQEKERKSTARP